MHLVGRTLLALIACTLLVLGQNITGSVASAHTSGTSQPVAASTCLQPPQNVDLMTLSDAQLQSYGLPTHQLLNLHPGKWSSELTQIKHHVCGSHPIALHGNYAHVKQTSNTLSGSAPLTRQGTSSNWAGYYDPSNRGFFTEADSNFTVPSVDGCGSPVSSAVSEWVGVGGVGGGVLVQAGVQSIVYPLCQVKVNAWYEVYPNFDPVGFNFTVNPGDTMYAVISSNEEGDGYDYFFVEDDSSGNYSSHFDYNHSDFSDSASGECILERPGNPSLQLARFSTDQFSNCETGGGNPTEFENVGNWAGDTALTMVNNGHTLASVSGLTNNYSNFTVTWHASS